MAYINPTSFARGETLGKLVTGFMGGTARVVATPFVWMGKIMGNGAAVTGGAVAGAASVTAGAVGGFAKGAAIPLAVVGGGAVLAGGAYMLSGSSKANNEGQIDPLAMAERQVAMQQQSLQQQSMMQQHGIETMDGVPVIHDGPMARRYRPERFAQAAPAPSLNPAEPTVAGPVGRLGS